MPSPPAAPATMQGNANTELSSTAISSVLNIGNLSNKVALITGGSSGLGRAIAQAYAAAGAFVVSADLTPTPPDAPIVAETLKNVVDLKTPTVDLLNARFPVHGGAGAEVPRSIFVQCDVTSPESMEAAVKATVSQYGRLDIMVNNAGIAAEASHHHYATATNPSNPRLHDTDVSVLDKDIAVNVRGVWLGCKYAVAQMLSQPPSQNRDRGWIINMCSIMGLVGSPGTSAYCASKGAVLQMTKAIALEYAADRIHVNCINPGFAETSLLEPMRDRLGGQEGLDQFLIALHPWGRIAVPDDIAKMAVFLGGEGASFCTGQAFVVDGGYTAR